MPTLNPGSEDARRKKKPTAESQKSASRRLADFKDKVLATISGPNENSDSEAKVDLPARGHNSQGNVETLTGKTNDGEVRQLQQQKTCRTTQKSIPIVLKTDAQKELSSVMDDRPPVPAKNHARPQVQHKLEKKLGPRNQISPDQNQGQDQLESVIIELQEKS